MTAREQRQNSEPIATLWWRSARAEEECVGLTIEEVVEQPADGGSAEPRWAAMRTQGPTRSRGKRNVAIKDRMRTRFSPR